MSEQAEEYKIPVYLICGFLESGKTRLIREMLEDDGFSSGERTLILMCEEGEEELDKNLLKKSNAVVVSFDSLEDMSPEKLQRMEDEFMPERIIIEYNAVWGVENLFKVKKPSEWELAQMVALIDSTTYDNYMTNMRQMMCDAPKLADLVIVNRCNENTEKSRIRRAIKAMNNSCNIMFENLDGTADDGVADEDLPYDMKADIIEVSDDDFGIWYLDAMDHPDRYNGRTMRLRGQAFDMNDLPKRTFVFGRYAMTCCANDVGGIGFVCKYLKKRPKKDSWIWLTCKVEAAYSPIHDRDAIILIEIENEETDKPKEELVYFNK